MRKSSIVIALGIFILGMWGLLTDFPTAIAAEGDSLSANPVMEVTITTPSTDPFYIPVGADAKSLVASISSLSGNKDQDTFEDVNGCAVVDVDQCGDYSTTGSNVTWTANPENLGDFTPNNLGTQTSWKPGTTAGQTTITVVANNNFGRVAGDPSGWDDGDPSAQITAIVLEVVIDKPTENQTFEIDHDTMQISSPSIVCEAKAMAGGQDYTSQVTLVTNWELLLTWTGGGSTYYTPGPTANDKLESSDNPYNVSSSAFTTGGDLSVDLSGTLNGSNYEPASVSGVTIKVDEDPSNADFSTQLGSDIIRAIAWQEWAGLPTARWNHYNSSGQPLVHGSDWGIMQVNKPVWEWWFESSGHSPSGYTVAKWNKMAWNWKINIANGKYIHQTYMYSKQTDTQKTWPNTADDKSTPNREDLATYGYTHGESDMRAVTSDNWSTTVEDDTYTQNVRTYKANKPWQ